MKTFFQIAAFTVAVTTVRAVSLDIPEAGVSVDLPSATWRQTAANVKSPAGTIRAAFTSPSGAVVSVMRSPAETNLNFAAFTDGFRGQFSATGAKLLKEEKTQFAGHDALRFQGSVPSKVGTVIINIVTYMVDKTAWTISCSAPEKESTALAQAIGGIKEVAAK